MANQPLGEKARGRTSQKANQPGGKKPKKTKKPRGERAKGRISQGRNDKGAKKPDTDYFI